METKPQKDAEGRLTQKTKTGENQRDENSWRETYKQTVFVKGNTCRRARLPQIPRGAALLGFFPETRQWKEAEQAAPGASKQIVPRLLHNPFKRSSNEVKETIKQGKSLLSSNRAIFSWIKPVFPVCFLICSWTQYQNELYHVNLAKRIHLKGWPMQVLQVFGFFWPLDRHAWFKAHL